MLAVDIMHLKEAINRGAIDAGVIIVPHDRLSRFLTDRTPNLATAIKHVEDKAQDMPVRIVAFGHDGVGSALKKCGRIAVEIRTDPLSRRQGALDAPGGAW